MPVFVDQLGRRVQLDQPPQRIISLVPSQTELLADLALDDHIAGITKFCVHPEPLRAQKMLVGGTKSLKPEIIRQLNPDLIIANKEENNQADVEGLAANYPVWVSDTSTLQDALEMIEAIGNICHVQKKAGAMTTLIQQRFDELKRLDAIENSSCIYLIWKNPYMAAGGNTFIHSMLAHCGFENAMGSASRYPVLSLEEIKSINPSLLLLASEPFPFKAREANELQQALPHTRILLVDGEMFSWYGSRLLLAPAYFAGLRRQLRE